MNFIDNRPTPASASNWSSLSRFQRNLILIVMTTSIVMASIGIGLLTAKIVFILSMVLVTIGAVALISTSVIWLVWSKQIVKKGRI